MIGKNESQLDEPMLRLSSASGHFDVINYKNREHSHNANHAADIFRVVGKLLT